MKQLITTPAATTAAVAAALLALLLSILTPPASAASFKCSGTPTATCTSLLGFPVVNSTVTNYTTIASLFGIPLPSLLDANNAPASAASRPVSKPTVTVPIPCTCAGGFGTSGNTTRYVVKKGDGLDHIARDIFGLLVIYQEVAKFNNIANVDLIEVGQVLFIPLPCSCDQDVPGEKVVHYAYKVTNGDSFDSIANRTGASVTTIKSVNAIDPKGLKEEQILDVPLRICGPSPSPLLVGTNLTTPAAPCPATGSPAASPGATPTGSSPAGSRAATGALPGSAWTTILVLSHVLLLILSVTRIA